MRVILQKDIKNLGLTGDIVSVKKGYARHFLFPKKQAIAFTKASAGEARHRRQMMEFKKKKALNLRKSLTEKLKDLKLSFVKSVGREGRLFGSVTAFEIAKKLQEQGCEVDKRSVKLPQALKSPGEHEVLLDLGSDMKTQITVQISPESSKKE